MNKLLDFCVNWTFAHVYPVYQQILSVIGEVRDIRPQIFKTRKASTCAEIADCLLEMF